MRSYTHTLFTTHTHTLFTTHTHTLRYSHSHTHTPQLTLIHTPLHTHTQTHSTTHTHTLTQVDGCVLAPHFVADVLDHVVDLILGQGQSAHVRVALRCVCVWVCLSACGCVCVFGCIKTSSMCVACVGYARYEVCVCVRVYV
jgi:hypothetical protein